MNVYVLLIVCIIVLVAGLYYDDRRKTKQYNNLKAKYDEIKSTYPMAFSAFLKKNNLLIDDNRPSTNSLKKIVEISEWQQLEEEEIRAEEARIIRRYEENLKQQRKEQSRRDQQWAKEQKDFANHCYEIAKNTMQGFGCYPYTTQISTIKEDGDKSQLEMFVWQHFPYSLSLYEDLDYTNVSYIKERYDSLPEYKSGAKNFDSYKCFQISDFISELCKDDDVLLCFNYNHDDWDALNMALNYSETYMGIKDTSKVSIIHKKTPFNDVNDLEQNEKRKIVIIDIITENDDLKANCAFLFDKLRNKYPLIAYISLLKCFDRNEITKIIRDKNAEVERKRAEEEYIALKNSSLSVFGEKIKDWVLLDYGLRINWLVEFHVDTDYRLLDKKELEDNKLVWNFRNDNNWKYLPSEYQIYPNESFPISLRLRIAFKIHELLCNTFGEKYLQFLTLVCIPASSAKKNDDRYKDFANILCNETRMENATSYIRYLNDGISKYDKNNNTGNAIPPTFSYKTELFRGKCILLVDDMIIEGKTMVRYKELFSNMGAHVIGGICIGINQELVKQGQQYIDQSLPLLNKIYEDRQRLHDEKIAEEKRKQAEKEAKEKREKEEQEKEEKEEIERKLKEIERKQKEFEEQKNNAPAVFSTKVKQWEPLRDGFHYTWLDYYYPVDIPNFEATRKEWDVRKLVWNFKNRDKKLKPEVHRLIASDVAWRIQECLNETFGEQYLQFLTLVCIPASTKEMYEVRYQDFSNSLCRFTNMENAYEHIQIVQDGKSKNDPNNTSGRSTLPIVKYDKDFFKGKYVLLFDDVITKGETMLLYRKKMEQMGAKVVGGICIGKTKHTREET